jgi:hypothetical protein
MNEFEKYLELLKKDVQEVDSNGTSGITDVEMLLPPAKEKIQRDMRNFLATQQQENFKLHKEIIVLVRDVMELEKEIEKCNFRIHTLEDMVGVQATPIPSCGIPSSRGGSHPVSR